MAQGTTPVTARGAENFWNRVFREALKGHVCSLCEVISPAGAGGSPRFFCLRKRRLLISRPRFRSHNGGAKRCFACPPFGAIVWLRSSRYPSVLLRTIKKAWAKARHESAIMRPLVNLSNRPFRNRRLFWLAILLLFVVPAYFGLGAIGDLARRQFEIDALDAEIQRLEGEVKASDKSTYANVTISADRNLQLVAASEFIARRGFSWSQLLDDIERNLPGGVRVLRVAVAQIQPNERDAAGGENDSAATLIMTVIGKSGADVTTMINKFHESRRFRVSPVSAKPVEGTEETEFDLKVEYLARTAAPRAGLSNQVAEKNQ